MTWATSVPIFIGVSVSDLGPMYATDRQTSDAHRRLMPIPYRGGGIMCCSTLNAKQLMKKLLSSPVLSSILCYGNSN